MSRSQWTIGLLLWVLTAVGLSLSHRQVGYVRDEGIYMLASRSYAGWVLQAATSPSHASDRKSRDRAFSVNHEHPALMKVVAGLSARMFSFETRATKREEAGRPGAVPVMPEGAAMRLPAQVLAGFGVALLFWVGCRWGERGRGRGTTGGLVAAGAFILLPRVWFNAGLHAFDVPVAVAIFAVALVYLRALRSARWGVALGPLLGVAIAIKHNALFLGPLLALHLWVCLARHRRAGRTVTLGAVFGLPLLSMAVLGPLVAWALWPWMWSDTAARLAEYAAFHRQHNWYNMEFLGVNYNQPPMPVAYPAVMTWATVPSVLLALAAVGIGVALWRDHRGTSARAATGDDDAKSTLWTPVPEGWDRSHGLWLVLLAAFPLALISAPDTPIFGGTKHWITAYPFLALAAAVAWKALWGAANRPRWAPAAALVLVLGPTAHATFDGHPYGLSQYAPLVGGPRGAARLGLNRGFWGHAVVPLFPEIRAELPDGGRLYLHDLHVLAFEQYLREGRLPADLAPGSPHNAQAGLLFHELHMKSDELELRHRLGRPAPTAVITLDDVPLTSLYGP